MLDISINFEGVKHADLILESSYIWENALLFFELISSIIRFLSRIKRANKRLK